MKKLYNTQENIANDLANFFEKVTDISKPHLKIVPYVILGMIESESVVTTNIVKKLKGSFSQVNPFSTVRRLERFFNNEKFDVYQFYQDIISNVIHKYNPQNKEIYISVDHMHCRDDFTMLLFSLKIEKQGIPLWFRCFKGKKDPEAYRTELIKEGIKAVNEMWKDTKYELIFLADRWFQNCEIMKYIEKVGATYCIRIKSNLGLYIYNYEDLVGCPKDVKLKEEEQYFEKVEVLRHGYRTQLAVGKKGQEAMYVLTNGKVEEGIKNYSYRYGSIEFVFKNQKTNGFHLESTKMKNLQAFKTMFGLMCVALLWVTILGMEYSVNGENQGKTMKIRCYRRNTKERLISLFKTGLLYFNMCFNSYGSPKLRSDFCLYEI